MEKQNCCPQPFQKHWMPVLRLNPIQNNHIDMCKNITDTQLHLASES